MDSTIPNVSLVKRLLCEKNNLVITQISELSVKHKRKVFGLLRKETPTHANYLFLQYSACTLGEFCTTQVLLSDGKRKFKDFVSRGLK